MTAIEKLQDVLEWHSLIVVGFISSFVIVAYLYIKSRKLLSGLKRLNEALDRSISVLEVDGEGKISKVNNLFCEMSGYNELELLGQNVNMLKSGLHTKEYYKEMWSTLTSGKVWNGEICNRKKDGSFVWLGGPILPVFHSGKIVSFMALRQDITARKELESQLLTSRKLLEENLDWRRNILDSANYIIIATDKEGMIVSFNKNAEKILGYQAAEIVGLTNPVIFHKNEELIILSRKLKMDVDSISPEWSSGYYFDLLVKETDEVHKPVEHELTYIRKDGSNFPARISVSGLRDSKGLVTGYLIIGNDITQEKIIKNQLILAKDLALQGSKVKSDFLASMSHEIRTPLNGIMGMTDLLIESGLNEDQNKCAEAILTSSQSLLTIINDILDFSKIEAGKMELENIPFNLKAMIDDHVQVFKFSAEKKDLYFKNQILDFPNEVYGDPARLGQILNNLISNALKFTSKGGIILSCDILDDQPQEVTLKFSVRDSGIGLNEEAKGRMFKSFSQADKSTSRKYGGTGLGLSIVKKLIEMMGGEIQFDSTEGVGTTFWFVLHFKKGEKILANYEVERKISTLSPIHGRILVAEDVTTNQQLFSRVLKKFGCQFQIVSNGKECLTALEENAYDLILMDCHMPEMDGYEATREIRKMTGKPYSTIPILALTANALKGDKEKCLEEGMTDFLSKPISQNKLHEALTKYLKKAA